MADRAVMFGITFVLLIVMLVSMIEYFVPLSAKFELNAECRKTQLRMENEAGLSATEKNNLQSKLASLGFSNITITAPNNVKYGEEISLNVEAIYIYSKVAGLFARQDESILMRYNKTSIARKVVN